MEAGKFAGVRALMQSGRSFVGNELRRIRQSVTCVFATALLAFAVCGIGPAPVQAAPVTLLNVTGDGTAGETIQLDEAVVASFNLGQAHSNVSVSADLVCFGCVGEIFLMHDDFGPTSGLPNLIDAVAYDGSTNVDPIFTGLNLAAGDYFLIVAVTGGIGTAWVGSATPVITLAPDVTLGFKYFASPLDSPSFISDFSVLPTIGTLHLTVIADEGATSPPPVLPAPAALWIFAGGVLFTFRRR